jgi:hypothetical protein
MSQQSSEFYFLPIDQNRTKSIKNVQNKAESWKKDSEHKVEKTNDFCQMLHNMRNPTVRKSFAMNGRASGRSIDWKIRELMILIASVHDFNFFPRFLCVLAKNHRKMLGKTNIYQVKLRAKELVEKLFE